MAEYPYNSPAAVEVAFLEKIGTYSFLAGCQVWYLVQSLCPGFRACPLEWYMYASPSPEKFSLCSSPYLFGFSNSSCMACTIRILKWCGTHQREVARTYFISGVISDVMEPAMPLCWNLWSIITILLCILHPPVSSCIIMLQKNVYLSNHKCKINKSLRSKVSQIWVEELFPAYTWVLRAIRLQTFTLKVMQLVT